MKKINLIIILLSLTILSSCGSNNNVNIPENNTEKIVEEDIVENEHGDIIGALENNIIRVRQKVEGDLTVGIEVEFENVEILNEEDGIYTFTGDLKYHYVSGENVAFYYDINNEYDSIITDIEQGFIIEPIYPFDFEYIFDKNLTYEYRYYLEREEPVDAFGLLAGRDVQVEEIEFNRDNIKYYQVINEDVDERYHSGYYWNYPHQKEKYVLLVFPNDDIYLGKFNADYDPKSNLNKASEYWDIRLNFMAVFIGDLDNELQEKIKNEYLKEYLDQN